jgi:hypothetical protein
MDAAQPGLGGNYIEPPEDGWSYDSNYWRNIVRPRTLRAIGIHELGEEARHRMRPDSPELIADQFHPWVWDAALHSGLQGVGKRLFTPPQDQ